MTLAILIALLSSCRLTGSMRDIAIDHCHHLTFIIIISPYCPHLKCGTANTTHAICSCSPRGCDMAPLQLEEEQ